MSEQESVGYRVVGTIKKVKGFCSAGHKVGDQLELSGHNTAGLCGFFYHDIFPYVIMLQFGGGFPAEWGNPDPFILQVLQGKSVDPEKVLEKAAGILNCHLDYIRHSRRISRSLKEDRDLLVYLVWKICILSNEEPGRLFGMTYSAISHILGSMRTRMQKDSELRVKYNNVYSLCKM